ncbi:hypothetical protein [Humidesulfovibrio sp.]
MRSHFFMLIQPTEEHDQEDAAANENPVHNFSFGFVRFGNQSIAQTEKRAQEKVIIFSMLRGISLRVD